MQAENWEKVKQVLEDALEIETAARPRFLDESNLSPEIRREVESLLAVELESENLMRFSAVEFSRDFFDADDAENSLVGQKIGAYKIVGELGSGGMGAVYLAERNDGEFAQKVALKLLKREMNTGTLRRRFRREREILASLEHANIARLLDGGTTADKIPFLAMEYVEGLPIDVYCDRRKLDLNERLNLFRTVCGAVGFAHRNLIVHRDLKPSNILVTTDGTPKLLDFGISKILSAEREQINSATVTRLGAMTPAYASPEQLHSKSVTTATDIYSLGVILYELLCGHRPFETKEDDLKEIYKAVLENEPPPPSAMLETSTRAFKEKTGATAEIQPREVSAVAPEISESATQPNKFQNTAPIQTQLNSNQLRGDLDNIVLKALRKEPERRYSSAENFAEDVRRHQNGLPVTARPNTFSYRAEKFIRRHRGGVFAGILIALAIFGGVVATLWQARLARAERAKAERRFNDVRALANSFLFEFSPKIEKLPGSIPARQLLVTRALEYLDNLSRESADDAQLQNELAKAYEKVGDVQGNPSAPNIGDVKGALESYEKSRSIRQKLLAAAPENSVAMSELASVLELIAGVHSNGGDYAKSAGIYDEALALREEIARRDSQNFEARAKLAKLWRARGLIPFYEGENKKAVEFYRRAQEINEKLLAEQPENAQIAEQYAFLFTAIGEAQGWDNEPEIAGVNLQKGLDLLIPLAAGHPLDQSLQRSLMLAYNKRAENYQDVKEFEKSVDLFSKGVAIADALLRADPQNYVAKRDVAMSNKKLAQALDDAGRSRESLEKLTLALNAFAELAAADPNNTEAPYDVANTRFSIGETYLTIKDYDAARAAFEQAKKEFQTVLKLNPNTYAERMSAYNLHRLGKTYIALADRQSRVENERKALENIRAGYENLSKLKNEGRLGEVDFEALDVMEKEIAQLENKIGD